MSGRVSGAITTLEKTIAPSVAVMMRAAVSIPKILCDSRESSSVIASANETAPRSPDHHMTVCRTYRRALHFLSDRIVDVQPR